VEKIVEYFIKRHFVTNFLLVAVFVGGFFAWQYTNKEELPDVTFDRVRISVGYPGAPAEDVEYFVTDPIEEVLRGIDGIYRVTSNSSVGISSISVEIAKNHTDIDAVLNEIRNEVLDVDLPDEVIDDPDVRIFKTSKKSIIDIALFNATTHLLSLDERRDLQEYVRALEDHLLALPEVNSVDFRGYLQPEIQVRVDPAHLIEYEIPLSTVVQEIRQSHIRKPAGTIEASGDPKVTLLSEFDTPEKLNNLIVQGGFEGGVIRLDEIARVMEGFEKTEAIYKVNGHEAIFINVVKNSAYGIIEALEAVQKVITRFEKNNLAATPFQLVLLDDESIDIRNRLSLISLNGIIGFVLIVLTLLVFLNKESGFWVAMGIPFTFCLTLICGSFIGYTINGTTLAAVILVMGIIVDDAIVVAENIARLINKGMDRTRAAIEGTTYVLLPIVASIVTTCIAFVPLFFFRGRFGEFIKFMPPVIFLMLGASLLESVLILPGHLSLEFTRRSKKQQPTALKKIRAHWFEKVEDLYGMLLRAVLPFKWIFFLVFIAFFIASLFLVKNTMKFVMFPNEETREIVLNGTAFSGATRFETAELSRPIEAILKPYIGKEVVGFRTVIARSRRGSAVEENKFRMIIEIVSREKRKKSADQLIAEINAKIKDVQGFAKLEFQKSRFGQSSGSAIEIIVQQSNDQIRTAVLELLITEMHEMPVLKSIEIDEGYRIPEYRITIDQEKTKRLAISPSDIASTLRSALEGSILYEFTRNGEDIDLRLTTIDSAKDDIEKVLAIPVENRGKYLVPLGDVVHVKKIESPSSIYRQDMKRTTLLYADLVKGSGRTPLEIAETLEEAVFPKVLSRYPTTNLSFSGEVQDTRESQADLVNAIILAVFLIYAVLAMLFQSLVKPLIIMLVIPFGVVGIVLAFWLHGKTLFGFYAAIGALGLAGVVINDSIIMLVKLDKEFDPGQSKDNTYCQIAAIAQTRLRAVVLTTVTTVVGVLPTAYGFAGYDAMLAEMMLALAWGLMFGTIITLILIPCVYSVEKEVYYAWKKNE
jgi:multidrug efflux pump subunit AcrB